MIALLPGTVVSFKPHLRRAQMPSGDAFLVSETQRYFIPNGPLARVAELVDGRRSLEDLVRDAAPALAADEVVLVLDELDAAGYLSVPDDGPREEQSFWHELGCHPAPAAAEHRVQVDVVSDAPLAWRGLMEQALREAGVSSSTNPGGDGAAVHIVLTTDYLAPDLVTSARDARDGGVSWLPVKPSGARAFIGPLLSSEAGPCWSCLVHALRRNRPVEQFIAQEGVQFDPVGAAVAARLTATLRTVLSLAAIATAQHLFRAPGAIHLRDRLLEVQFGALQTLEHPVVRRPQCPACGDAGLMRVRGEAPVRLKAVRRSPSVDGGYRSCAPEETYDRYRHLVSPITGTVTHLGPMPERHGPQRAVYTSGYLVCPTDTALRSNAFDKACAGKGRSLEQARASALCEALERASSVFQGDEARLRGCQVALGQAAICPSSLQLFSERQLEQRHEVNAVDDDVRRQVPAPFDRHAEIDWTPAWSITCDVRRYVPLAYCFSEVPEVSGVRFCRHNPNGTAAGNCLEEAILHGLLELIERDAAALWWYNRALRRSVDLERFEDDFFSRTVADFAEREIHLWVLDLTHDLGVYTFAAITRDSVRDRFTLGLGCHLDARVAIQRAISEVNQLFDPEGRRSHAWDIKALPSRDFLFPDPRARPVTPTEMPNLGSRELRADVQGCVERLRRAGLELIVVDKTRPDIGASVAQVIVPGLRHFWPRFAPGRLYDVPFQLGWVSCRATEDSLNPVPLFL